MNAVVDLFPPKRALEVACDLVSNYGIPVFPCRSDKQPLTERGFKDASMDLDGVEFWFGKEYPHALVGVPTGSASKLLVIDVDPDGADWYLEHSDKLACACIHKTRRGHHLLYRMPAGDIRNSVSKIAPGIDVRANGGYIIWWPAQGLEVVGGLDDVTAPPGWLLQLLTKPPATASSLITERGSGIVHERGRNEFLSGEAYRLRKAGCKAEQILEVLRALNSARCSPTLGDDEVRGIAERKERNVQPEAMAGAVPESIPQRSPIDWEALAKQTPSARDWIIDHWIPRNEVTLLSGPGGIGKTGVAQALASTVAVRTQEYLDWIPSSRKVLMWAAEDDVDELWRRQAAIGKWLNTPLEGFAGKLFLESFHRVQVDLAVQLHGQLVQTPMLKELREQIGDYGVELVVLDNIARLFGGNENDRHQVSTFITWLNWATEPTKAGLILLGHPAKAAGSEFSGSTAWEGAVRTRLYLGSRLPDSRDNDENVDDGVRYLCRRKANYSTQDWRRIHYRDGVMVPEPAEKAPTTTIGSAYAQDVVIAALRKLTDLGEHGNGSTRSDAYLPRLAKKFGLLDRLTERQFASAMVELQKAGRLKSAQVGVYQNRTAKQGFVEVSP